MKKLVIEAGKDPVEMDMDEDEIASMPVALPPILPALTRRQLRLWLLAYGKEDADVRAAIATIPDPQARKAAVIEWEDSTVFQRQHPLIAPIAAMLGLATPEAIDAGWLEASQI